MPTYLVGPTRTYTTIGAATSAIPFNLTGTGVHNVVIDAGIYNEYVQLTNLTTISDYVHLQAATGDEHNFNLSSGVRIFGTAGNSSNNVVRDNNSYSRFSNLIARTGGGTSASAFSFGNNALVTNCVGIAQNGSTPGIGAGSGCTLICSFALITGAAPGGFGIIVNSNCALYNCGVFGWGNGYLVGSLQTNVLFRNCYSGCAVGWTISGTGSVSASCSNNASRDSSAPGSNKLTGLSLAQMAFVSTSTSVNNFHITQQSSLRNAGANLSSLFTTDIDLETIVSWSIGPDAQGPSIAPVPTTASSPYQQRNARLARTPDAKTPRISALRPERSKSANSYGRATDAKASSINSEQGQSSSGVNSRPVSTSSKSDKGVKAKPGLANSYISITPNLGAYVGTASYGKGIRVYADKESLSVAARFQDQDLVGVGRAIQHRKQVPKNPAGDVTLVPRSNDILVTLMSHFQLRHGSLLSGGTTYYEFAPVLRSPSPIGASFGTGSYGTYGDLFTVNVTKLVNGSALRFEQGVCDKLGWEFGARSDVTLTAGLKFKSVSIVGSSAAGSTGSYSTLPAFSGFNSNIDFMGVSPVSFNLNLKNNISDYTPTGGTSSFFKFTNYVVEGKATIDLSKVSLAYLGSMLGTQGFSISGTLRNDERDKIIFQLPACKMDSFEIGMDASTLEIPFKAYQSDAGLPPVKVMVWTRNYSGTSFEPN